MGAGSHAERVRSAVTGLPELLVPIPGRRNVHAGVPRSHEQVGFAPVPLVAQVCQSRAGRWRSAHLLDSDARCVFCDSVAPRG